MIKENPATYFRLYRESLGFTSQSAAKEYLAAKDLSAGIDYAYIDALNGRIIEQNFFKWRLLDPLPAFQDLEVEW